MTIQSAGPATTHPQITTAIAADWKLTRYCMCGDTVMKEQGETYLPMPSGFLGLDGDTGSTVASTAAYASYKSRAQFPEILAPTVASMVGVIHDRDVTIELPEGMEYIREKANKDGLPLTELHKKITYNLLTIGRYGLLAEAPEGGGDPYIAGYAGDKIINWDDDWFVVDDTEYERDGFQWVEVYKYREFRLGESGTYEQVLHRDGDQSEVPLPVSARGARSLTEVPFVVANHRDVVPDIETPILIGVSKAALANYQLSADYRWQLYMSGQETLVAINGDAPDYVGAGVVHEMNPGSDAKQPDLKYVSPSCSGIEAHRTAMEENRKLAAHAGASLLQQDGATSQESGEARGLRFKQETASIVTVAQASCQALEKALKYVAIMGGHNPDDVNVEAPTDLMDRSLTAQDVAALWGVVQEEGLSFENYHALLQQGGIASTERDADEEFRLIEDRALGEADEAEQGVDDAITPAEGGQ